MVFMIIQSNMKAIFLLVYSFVIFLEVNCQYRSLLKELDMKNPVIIGNIIDLRTKNMFDLMKHTMNQNQTILLTTNFSIKSVQQSPGIILDQNLSRSLYQINANFKKPWVIVGKFYEIYSRIDIPLYSLENGTLWEKFQYKSIQKRNKLAKVENNELLWKIQEKKNFIERRGNFENITLIGMADVWENIIILPKEWKKMAKVSTIVKDTYEVSKFYHLS